MLATDTFRPVELRETLAAGVVMLMDGVDEELEVSSALPWAAVASGTGAATGADTKQMVMLQPVRVMGEGAAWLLATSASLMTQEPVRRCNAVAAAPWNVLEQQVSSVTLQKSVT